MCFAFSRSHDISTQSIYETIIHSPITRPIKRFENSSTSSFSSLSLISNNYTQNLLFFIIFFSLFHFLYSSPIFISYFSIIMVFGSNNLNTHHQLSISTRNAFNHSPSLRPQHPGASSRNSLAPSHHGNMLSTLPMMPRVRIASPRPQHSNGVVNNTNMMSPMMPMMQPYHHGHSPSSSPAVHNISGPCACYNCLKASAFTTISKQPNHTFYRSTGSANINAYRAKAVSRKFECPTCMKCFTRAYSLKIHQMAHANLPRPHACKHCPRRFLERAKLNSHMKANHHDKLRAEAQAKEASAASAAATTTHDKKTTVAGGSSVGSSDSAPASPLSPKN